MTDKEQIAYLEAQLAASRSFAAQETKRKSELDVQLTAATAELTVIKASKTYKDKRKVQLNKVIADANKAITDAQAELATLN